MTGFEFKRARIDARLSVRKAAETLGVNPSTVSRWEAGDSPIPSAAAEQIAALATGTTHPHGEIAETLGRLYAVLEWVIGGAQIGPALSSQAMTAPAMAFPQLIARAHLPEHAARLAQADAEITDLMSQIPVPPGFPRVLVNAEQGAWQLGYYHRRAAGFSG